MSNTRKLKSPFGGTAEEEQSFLTMDGRAIFDFAIRSVPNMIRDVMQKGNLVEGDLKKILAHQANVRLLEAISKKVKITISHCLPATLRKRATLQQRVFLFCLTSLFKSKEIQLGTKDKVLMTGFGGGLTWGAIVVSLN